MPPVALLPGNSLEILRTLRDNSVDSVCCDPPYELGFMNKGWDRSGIANSVALWAEVLRVLKPGGHLLAFGGTRTYHRMAAAIEDAGFEVRDSLEWLYGSGFPKSLDVSKAIDKAAGASPEVVGVDPDKLRRRPSDSGGKNNGDMCYGDRTGGVRAAQITEAATEAARQWEGWGTALKPAHEPIVLARKPLDEKTIASNVASYGTGAINVDACRVSTNGEQLGVPLANPANRRGEILPFQNSDTEKFQQAQRESIERTNVLGRWPPNILLQHIPEAVRCRRCDVVYVGGCPPRCLACGADDFDYHRGCIESGTKIDKRAVMGRLTDRGYDSRGAGWGNKGGATVLASVDESVPEWTCVDGCPIKTLDAQTGERKGSPATWGRGDREEYGNDFHPRSAGEQFEGYGDTGGASRFFPQFHVEPEAPFYYCAKASRRERNVGCEALPDQGTSKSAYAMDNRGCLACGRTLPGGDKTTASCPRCGSDQIGQVRAKMDGTGRDQCAVRANNHPTVKPVSLMRWLVRLTCPPGGVVLDPFLGSGTTGVACVKEGFGFIGVELDPAYLEIARVRIAHARGKVAIPSPKEKAA